ncbi:MAG: hypothetical protein O3C45_08030 [Bacteroidetes bacterium]|nr:hypothetical protein [Bacteroidota bacterium]
MRSIRFLPFLALTVFLGACATIGPEPDPDATFGHRVDGDDTEGRTTIVIAPAAEDVEYRFFEASYESVTIRPDLVTPANSAAGVPVEVLIKGAFPDACSELHEVQQQRAGNLVLVTLTMRRPQGSVCASVLRPYRYYLDLNGRFAPGAYSLRLNDDTHAFVVREATGS